MKTKKVRVATVSSSDLPVRIDIVQKILGDIAEVSDVVMPFRELTPAEEEKYGTRLSEYAAILTRSGIFRRGLVEKLRGVSIIASHGRGVDHIDLSAASQLGIYVTNTPGSNATAVAEHTIALMLNVLRRISFANHLLRSGGAWEAAMYVGGQLSGKKLGLIGYGLIGSKVAVRAQAFGMEVLAYDPYVAENHMINTGVNRCSSIEDILGCSDIVSLHLPLTPDTYHIINKTQLKLMRPGALLINTSRGGLVDEQALYDELFSNHLGGAGLDVLEKEPPDTLHPLIPLPSVVVTPHFGGSTWEALETAAEVAAVQIRMALCGEVPHFSVNQPLSQKCS